LGPNPDEVIETLTPCVDEDVNPAKYSPITQREYNAMRGRLHYLDATGK